MIEFTDKGHSYRSPNKTYLSATTLISLVQRPFDKEYWSTYKAAEHILGKYFRTLIKDTRPGSQECMDAILRYFENANMIPQLKKRAARVREAWEMKNQLKRDQGTAFHKEKERKSYEQGHEINPFTNTKYRTVWSPVKDTDDNIALAPDLWELPDGYYPELLLWNQIGLAGQADKVFIETKDERYIDIDDYKTGKPITMEGYRFRDGSTKKLLTPLDHLEDCKYTIYSLQISLYAWMLEQFGFTPRHLGFHHYDKKYRVSYLKPEVLKLINHAISLGKLR